MSSDTFIEERATFRVDAFGCAFTVYGEAAPGGSKKAFKAGQRIVVKEDSKRTGPWRQQVAGVATALMEGRDPFEGPLVLRITFYRQRPSGQYGSGKNATQVKKSAPKFPIVQPDLTKLVRPLEDALKGIVWRDDNQVIEQHVYKHYGEPARAEVRVECKF